MRKLFMLTLLCGIICLAACGKSDEPYQLDLSQSTIDTSGLELKFGELVSIEHTGDVVVVKAKITPSYDNKATVDQNYHNVCHLIQDNGFDICSELQYWAVADMTDGSESKVVSFTVRKTVIDGIKNGNVVAIELGDYVDDLYIHQSLR